MHKYHKILNVFKRQEEKPFKLIMWQWTHPLFEYLADCEWDLTEKVDGTNIRIMWNPSMEERGPFEEAPDSKLLFGGKTDKAQLQPHLFTKLGELFTEEQFEKLYPETPMCIYGEGYGVKIQKGGKYIEDDVDFCAFDVMINNTWLDRVHVHEIAQNLGVIYAPEIGKTTLKEAVAMVIAQQLKSAWGDFIPEGIVARPTIELQNKIGRRVICKIKHEDF